MGCRNVCLTSVLLPDVVLGISHFGRSRRLLALHPLPPLASSSLNISRVRALINKRRCRQIYVSSCWNPRRGLNTATQYVTCSDDNINVKRMTYPWASAALLLRPHQIFLPSTGRYRTNLADSFHKLLNMEVLPEWDPV